MDASTRTFRLNAPFRSRMEARKEGPYELVTGLIKLVVEVNYTDAQPKIHVSMTRNSDLKTSPTILIKKLAQVSS